MDAQSYLITEITPSSQEKILSSFCVYSLIFRSYGTQVLQEFLSHKKDADILHDCITDTDLQFEDFKVMVEDLRSSNEGSQTSWR